MNKKSSDTRTILSIHPETFLLLIRQLRKFKNEADCFEIDLDCMKVKGDLRAIKNAFDKPLIGKTDSLALAKKAAKAGLYGLSIPKDLVLDEDFTTLLKNRSINLYRR